PRAPRADQPRQLEHGRSFPRASRSTEGPARPSLRLQNQRRAVSAVAGVPARAKAEDADPLGTERHLLHARGRARVPARPAGCRAAHARQRPLRRRGLARGNRRADQALPRRAGRRQQRGEGGHSRRRPSVRVLSVNIGLPREVLWRGKPVTTGIYKEPVAGRVALRTLNLDGDRQADLRVHGGPDKAVYAYPVEYYELWSRERPELELGPGTFGENLT